MTPAHVGLLQGVLRSGDESVSKLVDWFDTTDLDAIDGDAHRLLPLAFRVMADARRRPVDMDRLRGVYRKSWYRNQQHIAALAQVTRTLDEVGIRHSVVAGLPLALNNYADVGARTVMTTRLVVPPSDARRAIDAVSKRGYRIRRHAQIFGYGIPTVLIAPSGVIIDIRDFVYGPGWSSADDPSITGRMVEWTRTDVRSKTLDTVDAAVLAAAEAGSSPNAWLQGVVDVFMTLRNADESDWKELSARYYASPLIVPLHEAVQCLIEEVGVDLGAGAAKWLHERVPDGKDRLVYASHRSGRRVLRLRSWYRRAAREQHGIEQPSFPKFVAAVYGITSIRDALNRVGHRALRSR